MDRRAQPTLGPDFVCDRLECRDTAAELERARGIIRSQAVENTKLVEELSGAYEATRTVSKENVSLKRDRTRRANEDAEAGDIRCLLEFWRESHPKAQIPPGGRRWEVCKKALVLMADDEEGPLMASLGR